MDFSTILSMMVAGADLERIKTIQQFQVRTMKPALKASLQREAERAFSETIDDLRFAKVPAEIVLEVMIKFCAQQAELGNGAYAGKWLRRVAKKLSAVADYNEQAWETAVPFVNTLKKPAKRRRKTSTKTTASR